MKRYPYNAIWFSPEANRMILKTLLDKADTITCGITFKNPGFKCAKNLASRLAEIDDLIATSEKELSQAREVHDEVRQRTERGRIDFYKALQTTFCAHPDCVDYDWTELRSFKYDEALFSGQATVRGMDQRVEGYYGISFLWKMPINSETIAFILDELGGNLHAYAGPFTGGDFSITNGDEMLYVMVSHEHEKDYWINSEELRVLAAAFPADFKHYEKFIFLHVKPDEPYHWDPYYEEAVKVYLARGHKPKVFDGPLLPFWCEDVDSDIRKKP